MNIYVNLVISIMKKMYFIFFWLLAQAAVLKLQLPVFPDFPGESDAWKTGQHNAIAIGPQIQLHIKLALKYKYSFTNKT